MCHYSVFSKRVVLIHKVNQFGQMVCSPPVAHECRSLRWKVAAAISCFTTHSVNCEETGCCVLRVPFVWDLFVFLPQCVSAFVWLPPLDGLGDPCNRFYRNLILSQAFCFFGSRYYLATINDDVNHRDIDVVKRGHSWQLGVFWCHVLYLCQCWTFISSSFSSST